MVDIRKTLINTATVCMAFALALSVALVPVTVRAHAEDGEDNLIYLMGTAEYDKAYEVLSMINNERSKRGISTLSMDQTLMDAAMTRAAETVLYFEHARPNGGSWDTVTPKVKGENLGKGTGSSSRIMKLWMESDGHRENILRSRFNGVGVACFEYEGTSYWVQLFGTTGSEGAERPESGPLSVGIDLPGEDDAGGFHLDYVITSGGEPVTGSAASDADDEEDDVRPLRMYEGDSMALGLMGDYLVFDPAKLKWESTDPDAASVDESGRLVIKGAGEATISASSGSIKRASFDIEAKKNISRLHVIDRLTKTEDISERKYEDTPVCPDVTVIGRDGVLEQGRDYTLTYRDNEQAGTGSVESRGAGDYGGIITKEYIIK